MGKYFIMTVFPGWLQGPNAPCVASKSMTASRQFFLAMLCVLGWASTAHAVIPASERAVLTSFYASTNGAFWTNKSGWNGAVGTECTCFGITCDAGNSRVTGIALSSNNLVGTLPTLSGLPSLQSFQAIDNKLNGSIPSLSGLTQLFQFAVNSNKLSGTIPSLSGHGAPEKYFAYSSNTII